MLIKLATDAIRDFFTCWVMRNVNNNFVSPICGHCVPCCIHYSMTESLPYLCFHFFFCIQSCYVQCHSYSSLTCGSFIAPQFRSSTEAGGGLVSWLFANEALGLEICPQENTAHWLKMCFWWNLLLSESHFFIMNTYMY